MSRDEIFFLIKKRANILTNWRKIHIWFPRSLRSSDGSRRFRLRKSLPALWSDQENCLSNNKTPKSGRFCVKTELLFAARIWGNLGEIRRWRDWWRCCHLERGTAPFVAEVMWSRIANFAELELLLRVPVIVLAKLTSACDITHYANKKKQRTVSNIPLPECGRAVICKKFYEDYWHFLGPAQ